MSAEQGPRVVVEKDEASLVRELCSLFDTCSSPSELADGMCNVLGLSEKAKQYAKEFFGGQGS